MSEKSPRFDESQHIKGPEMQEPKAFSTEPWPPESSVTKYQLLAEEARRTGMSELAKRLSAHASELRSTRERLTEEFISNEVEKAKVKVQHLLYGDEQGGDIGLFIGIEGGSISEEALKRICTMFGIPTDLREREPVTQQLHHYYSRYRGQVSDQSTIYRYSSQGLTFELIATELSGESQDESRVLELRATKNSGTS